MRCLARALLASLAATLCAQTPNISVDVNLVRIPLIVSDTNGAPIKDLRLEDLTLLDNGRAHEIRYLWREELPLTIGFIADVSGSQLGAIGKHKSSILSFLKQVLRPEDRAFVATVDYDLRIVADLTNSIPQLAAGIDQIAMRRRAANLGTRVGEPCRASKEGRRRLGCNSAIWSGVYYASKLKMKDLPGRKVLILLSDGIDFGRSHSVTDAIEAAQGADTLVYPIRHLSLIQKTNYMTPILSALLNHMPRLAEETGGRSLKDSEEAFRALETELRSLVVLGFSPPEGTNHKIEVKANKPSVVVRARKAYTLPPQQ